MGTIIKASGLKAENISGVVKYNSPVSRGLEALHFTNTSTAKLARNYAPGKADGTVLGSPTVSSTNSRFQSGTNGIITSFKETTAGTFIFIAKSDDTLADVAHKPMLFGTYQSPRNSNPSETIGGVCTYVTGSGTLAFSASVSNSGSVPFSTFSMAASNLTGWAIYSVTMDSNSPFVFKNETTGTTATGSTNSFARVLSNGYYRIGTSPTSSTNQGHSDCIVWQGHSVALTTTEKDLIVADLRAYAAGKGITV